METRWIILNTPTEERHVFPLADEVVEPAAQEFLNNWDAQAQGRELSFDNAVSEVRSLWVNMAVAEIGGPENWWMQEGWSVMMATVPIHPSTLASSTLHWQEGTPNLPTPE